MRILSPAFADGVAVPVKYTCLGQNISPPFLFEGIPSGTQSLVLVVTDIDSDNEWVHWLLYNIPPETTRLDEGVIPDGAVQGICNGGTYGYEGPCPKYYNGTHRYAFRLYALSKVLRVDAKADSKVVLEESEQYMITAAELIGTAEGEKVVK